MALIKEGKAAIVATMGPASTNSDILQEMIDAGLDVVRLNMSHGTQDDHNKRFEMIRDVDDSIPILIDLSGPKIRIGELEESVVLSTGDQIKITNRDMIGTREKVSVSYPQLIDSAKVGNTLFLNDGLIELRVIEKENETLICKVVAGGPLSSRKGLNAPGVQIKIFAPTKKDLRNLESTISLEPDFYGLSFVRRSQDIQKLRDSIANFTTDEIPIVSKIEHQDALNNIDQITSMSDAIMVARGDLGVELPPEDIPLIQQKLVNRCNDLGKPCIVATQMLESMVVSPKPTRAEASDVANAILQGSDAVMLSAETATGNYPVQAVDMMDRIIKRVQHKIPDKYKTDTVNGSVPDSVGRSAVGLASALRADVILAFTRSGRSSASVAKFRPKQTILAVTPLAGTFRRIRLQWGVKPLLLKRDFTDTDEMIYQGIKIAYNREYIDKYDTAVIVAGSLLGLPASTNLIHYLKIDEIINSVEAQERFAKSYSLRSQKES